MTRREREAISILHNISLNWGGAFDEDQPIKGSDMVAYMAELWPRIDAVLHKERRK